MEAARNFLMSLCLRGVRLSVEAGRLRVRARKGALSAAELDQLDAHQDEIVRLLDQARAILDRPVSPRPASKPRPVAPNLKDVIKTALETNPWRDRDCTIVARIFGPLNTAMLARAITIVTTRHEALRTRFKLIDGVPIQDVAEVSEQPLLPIDLPSGDRDPTIQHLAEAFVSEPFHLAHDPNFVARLYRASDREHVLLFGMNHGLSDGMSLQILHREIWSLHQQMEQGLPPSLPEQTLQYADYCSWHESTAEAWSLLHEAYWRQRLQDAPRSVIPQDTSAEGSEAAVAACHEFSFGESISRAISEAAKREKVLPAIIGLAIYVAAMADWCQQSDLTVAFVYHGRDRPELENVVGLLVQNLRLRITVPSGGTMQELVQRVNQEYLAAVEHQDFGRARLISSCETELQFNWAPVSWGGWSIDSRNDNGISVRASSFRRPVRMKLGCFFAESPSGVTCRLEHRPDLLSADTIRRFADQLLTRAKQV